MAAVQRLLAWALSWPPTGAARAFPRAVGSFRLLAIALRTQHMCGRVYETYSDEELYFRYLSKRPLTPLVLSPIYNLCPTQTSPVLRLVAGERQFDQMRWQLVPATEPAFKTKLSTINARSEAVFQSRLYRDL